MNQKPHSIQLSAQPLHSRPKSTFNALPFSKLHVLSVAYPTYVFSSPLRGLSPTMPSFSGLPQASRSLQKRWKQPQKALPRTMPPALPPCPQSAPLGPQSTQRPSLKMAESAAACSKRASRAAAALTLRRWAKLLMNGERRVRLHRRERLSRLVSSLLPSQSLSSKGAAAIFPYEPPSARPSVITHCLTLYVTRAWGAQLHRPPSAQVRRWGAGPSWISMRLDWVLPLFPLRGSQRRLRNRVEARVFLGAFFALWAKRNALKNTQFFRLWIRNLLRGDVAVTVWGPEWN